MYKIAVFVSGRGSNLKEIHKHIETEKLRAEISVVVSNKKNCGAIDFAIDKNIPTFIIENENSYNELLKYLVKLNIHLIVLAGFLKKIPKNFIEIYKNKIINIHPALLPKYGGKGMYGMNVHKAVFNAKENISGATVHYVNEYYDEGAIIEQRKIDISNVKSPEEISRKVLKIEHELLPDIIKKFIDDYFKKTEIILNGNLTDTNKLVEVSDNLFELNGSENNFAEKKSHNYFTN